MLLHSARGVGRGLFVCLLLGLGAGGLVGRAAAQPLRLHPDNPHYLLFRGQPTVLVTSGEHYGAVLNLDFDYLPYLDELAARGLNLTRTFTGAYCEPVGAFNISGNTLAPASKRLICPWARGQTPGYANGGAKFDLTRWDDAYFQRLRDFVGAAGERGIVVELVLFCPFYRDEMWDISPQKATNNVNGVGTMPRTEAYTLKHPALLAVQDAMVRKIVAELRDFDNVYYEVCNEPYFGGVTDDWQDHIIDTLVAAERAAGGRHLIARNIANGSAKITAPHPDVSIFNFHYATPPVAVAMNYGLDRVLGDDETGFKGSADVTYRREGWQFLLAGGAIYSNLDYSFTPDHEAGTATPQAPGGGGRVLRTQLGILKRFVSGFDFCRMAPDAGAVKDLTEKVTAHAMVEPDRAWAIYLSGGNQARCGIALPTGRYAIEWIDTKTGQAAESGQIDHPGGTCRLTSPRYEEDIALAIRRAE